MYEGLATFVWELLDSYVIHWHIHWHPGYVEFLHNLLTKHPQIYPKCRGCHEDSELLNLYSLQLKYWFPHLWALCTTRAKHAGDLSILPRHWGLHLQEKTFHKWLLHHCLALRAASVVSLQSERAEADSPLCLEDWDVSSLWRMPGGIDNTTVVTHLQPLWCRLRLHIGIIACTPYANSLIITI